MQKPQMGSNRTGIQASPADAKKMMDMPKGTRLTPGDESGMIEIRTTYIQDSGPVGSVPPPATMKGAAKAGMQALTGKRAHTFIDRLGERLAFERSGTRLYEAMLVKCRATADGASQYLGELEHFCAEEAQHFRMLSECIEQVGGDPTAQTPGADVTGVESTGLMQVITDPMTSVTQSLHALLVAELADNDAWDELVALADELGQKDMAKKFQGAREEEREHLEKVRAWHKEATLQEARLGA
jgi:rubrerythrin